MTDYLHDPNNAPPDREIEALERALAPLRLASSVPSERVLAAAAPRQPRGWPIFVMPLMAAAAAVWLWFAWADDALHPDAAARTFVAEKRAVDIPLGTLAEITLQPGSELEFLHWRDDQARFRLRRGALTARVAPPPVVQPGFFVIDVPRGTVVDQGCQYELSADDGGTARVRVTEGAVTFADDDREVFVPAGASAAMTSAGLETPTFLGTSREVVLLMRRYDQARRAGDAQRRYDIAGKLLGTCQQQQATLPLWHLLHDTDPGVRKTATEALFRLAGAPDGKAELERMFRADEWLPHLRLVAWQGGG